MIRAIDGLDGLKKLYEAHPDLVIVDKEVPMVNGEELCLRIRQASYLPIIILGSGIEGEAVKMLNLCADAYVTKPNLGELLARIRSLLRRKPRDDSPQDNPGAEIRIDLPKGGIEV